MYKLIVGLLFCYISLFGQEKKKPLFLQIKKYDTENLIPFKKGELWGFLEKNSMKVVIKPSFKQATMFINGTAFVVYKDDYLFIYKNGEPRYLPPSIGYDNGKPEIINKEGWKGFTYKEFLNYHFVTSYSDYYQFINETTFINKNAHYAKVVSDKGEGIIDENGEIFNIFDFGKFMNIDYRMSIDKMHYLILFSDSQNHYFAIDEQEKKYDLGVYDDVFFSNGWNDDTNRALINLKYLKAVKDERVFYIDLIGTKYLPKK